MRPSYAERPPRSLVTGQLSILLRAHRPLLLISPVVMENAPRTMPLGSPVREPRSGKGDEPDRDADWVLTPSEEVTTDASSIPDASPTRPPLLSVTTGAGADANPAIARAASSAVSPVRAPSIIPSKRTRTETPRRAASASTQARRLWSRRMPTTVDLVVAMTR